MSLTLVKKGEASNGTNDASQMLNYLFMFLADICWYMKRILAVSNSLQSLGGLKVATYFIIIFYLIGFYCQIKISNRFLLPNYVIYFYLLNHLF